MNWKTITPLIVALVFGLGAAILARGMMTQKHASTAAQPSGHMVIARRLISPGQTISADDLKTITMADHQVPVGIFDDSKEVEGRVALMAIGADEPVLQKMLADSHADSGLQALLPDGMRAITVEVNQITGLAGFLSPGCRVDLLASLHNGQGTALTTQTLVQDVKVIAIGQSISPTQASAVPATDSQAAQYVTLVVTPQQAETIELASNIGRPRLVLRSGQDNQVVPVDSVTLAQLTGGELPAVAAQPLTAPAPRRPQTVEIIRGGVESVVAFPNGREMAQPTQTPRVAGGKADTAPIAPQ